MLAWSLAASTMTELLFLQAFEIAKQHLGPVEEAPARSPVGRAGKCLSGQD